MPILFEIYEDGRPVTAFDPAAAGAVVVGPESVPTPGRVTFEDNLLVVEGDGEAAGVMLEWDAGDAGRYTLETCRLPEREEPYLLSVELLRHRLMKVLQKQEDWALFDLDGDREHIGQRLTRVKAKFAEALGMLPTPAKASEFARQALP